MQEVCFPRNVEEIEVKSDWLAADLEETRHILHLHWLYLAGSIGVEWGPSLNQVCPMLFSHWRPEVLSQFGTRGGFWSLTFFELTTIGPRCARNKQTNKQTTRKHEYFSMFAGWFEKETTEFVLLNFQFCEGTAALLQKARGLPTSRQLWQLPQSTINFAVPFFPARLIQWDCASFRHGCQKGLLSV